MPDVSNVVRHHNHAGHRKDKCQSIPKFYLGYRTIGCIAKEVKHLVIFHGFQFKWDVGLADYNWCLGHVGIEKGFQRAACYYLGEAQVHLRLIARLMAILTPLSLFLATFISASAWAISALTSGV